VSQPLNFGPGENDPWGVSLRKEDQLEQIFHQHEVEADRVLMGIEYEIFAHDKKLNKPLAYEGPVSITSLYFHLVKLSAYKPDPWVALMEESNIVGITDKRATIALEPGGQIEIAAKPHNNLKHMNSVFTEVAQELSAAAQDLDISLFAVGIHPLAQREDMAQVKKNRYAIMRDYMQSREGLGLDMMTRTCSIQLNLDLTSEADMVEKTRLAACLTPIFSLLCSSSGFLEGKKTKYALERSFIWQQTDRDRTGIPEIIFAKNFGYEAWINFALDVPMYFIRRGNNYIDVAGASFREFMRHGLKNQEATLRDFIDHLSTIFTEVRLKPFLELRSCDSLPDCYVSALSAFTWGLFYDQKSRAEASNLFADISHEELLKFYDQTIHVGRAAKYRGQKIFDLTQILLDIAKKSLSATKNQDYLEPFQRLVENNNTCAEWQKENFDTINPNNIAKLISHFSPLDKPII